jgi:hypothetical protein
MGYTYGAWIGVPRHVKDYLDQFRDEKESWADFLMAILKGWWENNKKISQVLSKKIKK